MQNVLCQGIKKQGFDQNRLNPCLGVVQSGEESNFLKEDFDQIFRILSNNILFEEMER